MVTLAEIIGRDTLHMMVSPSDNGDLKADDSYLSPRPCGVDQMGKVRWIFGVARSGFKKAQSTFGQHDSAVIRNSTLSVTRIILITLGDTSSGTTDD